MRGAGAHRSCDSSDRSAGVLALRSAARRILSDWTGFRPSKCPAQRLSCVTCSSENRAIASQHRARTNASCRCVRSGPATRMKPNAAPMPREGNDET
ncbi:hypothetical protein CRM91_04895 [Burkholderia ambifaria]|nr:hypothetical protein CRM91_04895 [Burkholderia ambifaria]